MNKIILRGRLTDAAEIKVTSDEKSTVIARFTLAVQDKTKRNHNGDYDVDFIKAVAFNSIANNLEQYTEKGSEILVIGRLHTYTYKNQEQKNIYASEVIIENLEFISNCRKSKILDIPDEDLPFK